MGLHACYCCYVVIVIVGIVVIVVIVIVMVLPCLPALACLPARLPACLPVNLIRHFGRSSNASANTGAAEGTEPPTAVVAQACASQGGSQVAPCMAACCMATEERPPIPPAAIACLALYEPWVRHWHGGYHSMVGAWAASAKYALHAVIQAVWEEYEWTAYCGQCHFLFRFIMHCEFCGGRLRCAQQLWPDVT